MYGFICRFTTLRGKVEGLDSPMKYVYYNTPQRLRLLTCAWMSSFEEALLNDSVDPVMTQILSRFVLNLKPQTRNLR